MHFFEKTIDKREKGCYNDSVFKKKSVDRKSVPVKNAFREPLFGAKR